MSTFTSLGHDQRDALLAALAHGMSGEQAAPLVDAYQAQAAQAQAERQEYLSGLNELITGQAVSGMSEDQTQMLVRSARLAAGLRPGSPVSQTGHEMLHNAYPEGENRIDSLPGGLSPLASAEATGGIDMEDVQEVNATVEKLMSQGMTDLTQLNQTIVGGMRQSFPKEWTEQPALGPNGQPYQDADGEWVTEPVQTSLMPVELADSTKSLIARAHDFYMKKMPENGGGYAPQGGMAPMAGAPTQAAPPPMPTPTPSPSEGIGPVSPGPGLNTSGGPAALWPGAGFGGEPAMGGESLGSHAVDFLGNLISGRIFGGEFF